MKTSLIRTWLIDMLIDLEDIVLHYQLLSPFPFTLDCDVSPIHTRTNRTPN